MQADAPRGSHGTAVRASTIDNFQGEEARVVIVSLTRSTARGRIGFLSEAQRVNVLLSRARDGLILVGNPNSLRGRQGTLQDSGRTLSYSLGTQTAHVREQILVYPTAAPAARQASAGRSGSAWEVVLKSIPVLPGFPARCQQHGQEVMVTAPGGFEALAPDGGCLVKCDAELGCGHTCTLRCHSRRQPHSRCMVMIDCRCAACGKAQGNASAVCSRSACHERDANLVSVPAGDAGMGQFAAAHVLKHSIALQTHASGHGSGGTHITCTLRKAHLLPSSVLYTSI